MNGWPLPISPFAVTLLLMFSSSTTSARHWHLPPQIPLLSRTDNFHVIYLRNSGNNLLFLFNLVFIKFAVIAPGFHTSYLEAMVKLFTSCSERTVLKIDKLLEGEGYSGQKSIELDLEAEFSNLALDIIGLGVFNYDFGSVTNESPVIKVWLKDSAFQIYDTDVVLMCVASISLLINSSIRAILVCYPKAQSFVCLVLRDVLWE